FLGIPYAAAPVGDLRWRAPQPAARWHSPLDASKLAKHCALAPLPFGVASATEDCLFLNVYAPERRESGRDRDDSRDEFFRRPVMVYIHGGAFQTGASNDYNPHKLVDAVVVVVTINYRLGSLGFFANPVLTAESPDGTS